MEEAFAEQIVPGTFVRVQSEGLIAPKGVSFGNVGIVGTAAAADGAPADALGRTHILGSVEDAQKLYKGARTGAADADPMNLMRGLGQLFRNGARTVYARPVAAAPAQRLHHGLQRAGQGGRQHPGRAGALRPRTRWRCWRRPRDGREQRQDLIAVVGADGADAAAINGPGHRPTTGSILTAPGYYGRSTPRRPTRQVDPAGHLRRGAGRGPAQHAGAAVQPDQQGAARRRRPRRALLVRRAEAWCRAGSWSLEQRSGVRVVRGLTTDDGGLRADHHATDRRLRQGRHPPGRRRLHRPAEQPAGAQGAAGRHRRLPHHHGRRRGS